MRIAQDTASAHAVELLDTREAGRALNVAIPGAALSSADSQAGALTAPVTARLALVIEEIERQMARLLLGKRKKDVEEEEEFDDEEEEEDDLEEDEDEDEDFDDEEDEDEFEEEFDDDEFDDDDDDILYDDDDDD